MAPLERARPGEVRDAVGRDPPQRLRAHARGRQVVQRRGAAGHRPSPQAPVEVVVDRVVVRANQRTRIADAVEAALDLGRGVMHVAHVDDDEAGAGMAGRSLQPALRLRQVRPQLRAAESASFFVQQPARLVPALRGAGRAAGRQPGPADPRRRAVAARRRRGRLAGPDARTARSSRFAEAIARHGGFSLDTPFEQLEPAQQHVDPARHGRGVDSAGAPIAGRRGNADARRRRVRFQYKGLFPAIDEASRVSSAYRQRLDHLVSEVPCSACGGSRLREDAAACRFPFGPD